MIHENIELTGSFTVSGSFVLPSHASSSAVYETGSMYHDTVDGVLKVYTGTQWVTVGEQTAPIVLNTDIDYLLVAGGGGAGHDLTAGGGAGGLLSSSLAAVTSGSSFTVTIGAGGPGYTTGTVAAANDGDDSTIAGTAISTITAVGGGGGSRVYTVAGRDGGSGGGCGRGNQGATNPGSGTLGQGNDGGADSNSPAGTGGGGAGAAGSSSSGTGNPSTGGNGGDGLASSITGTSVTYAGGGGGGGYYGSAGTGGSGGGGNGSGGNAQSNQENGEANKGGGAGGGGQNSPVGASGGSGVAIFAYDSSSFNAVGGIVGDAGNGRKYNQFNQSGTFIVGSTTDFQIHTTNLVMHVDAGNFESRNGNTSGIDLSGYGNNLNLGGQSGGSLSDNFWWEGRSGGIADFERNGGSMASNVAHTGYGTFTGKTNLGFCIDFWIKTTATGGWASGGKTIIGRNNGDIYSNITIYNNKLNFNHYPGSWQNESSTTSINDGNWHHCVLNNYSNETIDIWVDGTKENTGADSSISSGRYFKMDSLGRGYNSENTDMDIGQIRVYDTTLTDTQILQNYNATKTNFI